MQFMCECMNTPIPGEIGFEMAWEQIVFCEKFTGMDAMKCSPMSHSLRQYALGLRC